MSSTFYPGEETIPARGLYLLAAVVTGLVFVSVLFFVPRQMTIGRFAVWGLGPIGLYLCGSAFLGRRLPFRREALLVGLIAVFLRTGLGIYMYTHALEGDGFGSLYVKDDRFFFEMGEQIAGAWEQGELFPFPLSNTEMGPMLLQALAIFLFGPDPRNTVVFSSAIGALACLLLIRLARYFVSPRQALLCGLLLAVYPHPLYLAASNQRDAVITFLILALALVFRRLTEQELRGREWFGAWLWLATLILLLNVWRFYQAVVVAAVGVVWVLIASHRGRASRTVLALVVLVGAIGGIGLRLVSPERLQSLPVLLSGIDSGRAAYLDAARTFGFLSQATGLERFAYLPIILPLALIFGFGLYQNLPNNDLVSAGFLWFWYPLLIPMALGLRVAIRRGWRRPFLLWSIPLALLLLSAIGYHGLVPRYRAAAEPFLLVLAVMGLNRLGHHVSYYFAFFLALCGLMTVAFWGLNGLNIIFIVAGLSIFGMVVPTQLYGVERIGLDASPLPARRAS